MKRVLVTGAAGFIGTACLPLLAERGFEVHGVTRRSRHQPGARWHQADLHAEGAALAVMTAVQPTHLLHLAWDVSDGDYWHSPASFRWLVTSVRLFEAFAAAGGSRLVAAGTCAEYAPVAGCCREDGTPLRPLTLYGASKAALGTLLPAYALRLGLSWSWARLFHPYGPGDRSERFIPTLIRTLRQRRRMACTTGEQQRDFMYVGDAAEALVRLVDSDLSGSVNIASGAPLAVRTFVIQVASQLEALDLVDFGARPSSGLDAVDLIADVTRQREQLGFQARTPLADGISRTIAWHRSTDSRDA